MKQLLKLIVAAGILALACTGCATRSPYEDASDPLEPMNRVFYNFNDYLDRGILKPVAEKYADYVPDMVRTGVRNVYNNAFEPLTIVNDILQGKVHQTASDTMRFGFNTIFGVLGLIDVSTGWGLEDNKEDFGQTFARWGIGEGWYLVLPLLGPGNVRDAIGLVPESFLQPIGYISNPAVRFPAYALFFVSKRADLLSATKVLDAASLDPYLQVREGYRQKRWNDIYDGNPPEPKFFDEELFDE